MHKAESLGADFLSYYFNVAGVCCAIHTYDTRGVPNAADIEAIYIVLAPSNCGTKRYAYIYIYKERQIGLYIFLLFTFVMSIFSLSKRDIKMMTFPVVSFYASAFRRRRHYVFGLSVRPKPEIPSFDLYMGPLVHPTNRNRFTACPSVRLSVRPSVRPKRFPGICRRMHGGNGVKFYMLMYLHSGETDEANCSWLHPVWPPPKRPDQDNTFFVVSRASTGLIFCIHRDFDVRNNVCKPRRLVCECCRDICAWKSRVMKPIVLGDEANCWGAFA